MTTRRLGIDDLYALDLPEQPSLSPDGTRIVYVLRSADREDDRDHCALWTVPTGGGAARPHPRHRRHRAGLVAGRPVDRVPEGTGRRRPGPAVAAARRRR